MSIIIHIPKGQSESSSRGLQEDVDDNNDSISINLPKHKQAKANDLSIFDAGSNKDKCTLSGDDLNSNISFDSNNFHLCQYGHYGSKISEHDGEKEIEMENKFGTPKKVTAGGIYKNFYYNNNETNNYSSEKIICQELNSAQQYMIDQNNLSNFSNILAEKTRHNYQINTHQIQQLKQEDNFVFNVIRNSEKKSKTLNKGFISDQKTDQHNSISSNEERISKLNAKVNSMKKYHDNNLSKTSDSGYSSNSTSVKLTCFMKCTSKKD